MRYIKEIAEDDQKLEMTPMIDVTFLLLIFFLLTIKFKTLEGKLAAYLPKDVGVNTSPAEEKEKVEIKLTLVDPGQRINVRKQTWKPGDGRYDFVGRVVQYHIGPMKTTNLDAVQDRLEALYRQDSERPATIDARPGTTYGDIVPVLDAAIFAGYSDITFIGEYKQP